MKTSFRSLVALVLMIGCLGAANKAMAIPTLQLDISGGTYDSTTQTIVASSSSFTVYAYLLPDCKNTLLDTYYLSMATNPATGPVDSTLGSFSVNGTTINATEDMTYGTAPLENIVAYQGWDKGDLSKHSIFPTYFYEQGFAFSTNQISPYNTQDSAISGSAIPTTGTGMYYMTFDIDTSGLDTGYVIHFDLYNTKLIMKTGDIDVTQFAPFSHDAESCGNCTSVPEPSTLLLLGSGLVGLGFFRRRKKA